MSNSSVNTYNGGIIIYSLGDFINDYADRCRLAKLYCHNVPSTLIYHSQVLSDAEKRKQYDLYGPESLNTSGPSRGRG